MRQEIRARSLVVGVLRILALIAAAFASACGSTSATCGPGFEPQGGRCVAVCTEPCGLHEACNVTETSAKCACVPGYVGDPCEWGGGIQDPQFTSAEAWASTNGARIEALVGLTGPGIASFSSSVSCNAGAVSQVVEMPPYDDADPLVVEVTFRYENSYGIDVGYGRASRRLLSTVPYPEWDTDRFCLGEAAYGGEVKFQVAATERTTECFSAPTGSIEVDRFEILVADEGECAPPGELLNASADVGGGGWVFDVEPGPGGSAGLLEEGVGQAGSSGARIHKPAGSAQLAAMYTQLSVPLADSLPSPALRFWWQGAARWEYYVDAGTYPGTRSALNPVDWLSGTGAAQTSTYCLPPWTHGNVVDLSFVTLGGFFEDEADLVVDNVEIVSDPRCGSSVDVLDPSFDSAPNRWPGTDVNRGADPESAITLIKDSARAHPPGDGALEIRYGNNQAVIDATTWVWVPATDEAKGPTLRFHSNVPDVPGIGVFWTLGRVVLDRVSDCAGEFCPPIPYGAELPKGLGWRENTVCLPEEWAERWFRFRVQTRPVDGPLETFDPPRAVLLDDFEVTADEVCAR